MKTINEFGVIDFTAKRLEKQKQKELKKKYEYIKSKCEIGNVDLLDSLVDEVVITEESTRSLADFIKACQRRGTVPNLLFEQAIMIHEEDYHDMTGINWWIAVDEALTFFSMLKDEDEVTYRKTLERAVLKF